MSSRKSLLSVTDTPDSGKTTLVEQPITRSVHDGRHVASIKHTHHGFDLDSPGKDSHRMREAGSAEVTFVGGRRSVLMCEYVNALESELDDVLALLSPVTNLVITEGYKRNTLPKVEVFRSSLGRPPLWPAIGGVVAVATDLPGTVRPPGGMAVLDLNDVDAVYRFAVQQLTKSVI